MAKKQRSILLLGLFFVMLMGCKQTKKPQPVQNQETIATVTYATGFTVKRHTDFTVIEVTAAWPGADSFKYALVPKEKLPSISFPRDAYDAIIGTPVNKVVITSTTHLEPIKQLGE